MLGPTILLLPRFPADRNKADGDQNLSLWIRAPCPPNAQLCDKAKENHASGTWDQSEGLQPPAANKLCDPRVGRVKSAKQILTDAYGFTIIVTHKQNER